MLRNDLQIKSETYDPLMQSITDVLRARLPQATAIIFFGSRVAGVADAFSDYDVLVVMPEGLEEDERNQVKQEIQKQFPTIKLDVLFGSERWLRARLPYEPYYRFWLKNSLTTWGKVNIKRLPPLAVGAMQSYSGILKAEIEMAAVIENCRRASRIGINAVELLFEIEQGLKSDYDLRSVRRGMSELLGEDLIERIRDPHRRLTEKDRRRLVRLARAKFRAVAATLARTPQTSSDRRWSRKWAARSRASKSSNRARSA